jgi:serine/threonine protein kinase
MRSDYDEIVEKSMIGAELAISCLLSSFPRRGICPNFISIHGVFSCPFDPPASRWGSQSNKCPQGNEYDPSRIIRPLKEPSRRGKFQYIRMEFCNCGDVEEFMKPKNNGVLESKVSQGLLFQVAFALHVAAERFSLKHYDMKNLNIMLQRMTLKKKGVGNLVLRYGLGSHFFAVRMPASAPLIAKLADFGTSDIKPESNGKPVTPLQFTTFENTPPDYIILGDLATQGHGHDSFALGLCMLHMFTGETPYEEIMDSVTCPPTLKRLLRCKLEDSNEPGYSVIRSVILLDVCKDDEGNIVEGDPNGTFYDTLYRYLVLFGIPAEKFQRNKCPAVWDAIEAALEGKPVAPHGRKGGGGRRHPSKFSSSGKQRHSAPDAQQFAKDRKQFSLAHGRNRLVARARASLERMPGGMDLLLRLCCFDPSQRASALDVLNSRFMEPLREAPQGSSSLPSGHPAAYSPDDTVYTYSAFSTHGN